MRIRGELGRRDSEGVSPVIATILLVAITVVLAATLYYMVLGFGGDTGSNVPPAGDFVMDPIADGEEFTFIQFSKETVWSEISIIISDGNNITSFTNISTEDLRTGQTVMVQYGYKQLGALTVFLNVTDLVGNGYVNGGDSFTLTVGSGQFANNVTYEVTVIHNSSDSRIVSHTFQGE